LEFGQFKGKVIASSVVPSKMIMNKLPPKAKFIGGGEVGDLLVFVVITLRWVVAVSQRLGHIF
jgi:hypothetical protein